MDLSKVEKLSWKELLEDKGSSPEVIAALDDYFSHFAKWQLKGKALLCIKCDEPLNGDLTSMLFGKGGFTWGLAHGEGHCKNCGWPARAHHRIKAADGSELCSLTNVILQYHPEFVEEKKSDE